MSGRIKEKKRYRKFSISLEHTKTLKDEDRCRIDVLEHLNVSENNLATYFKDV